MDQKKITCECRLKFNEEEFERHFSSCQPFKLKFKEFDSKFSQLLISYSEPKERLLIIKFLLKQYIYVIDKKLRRYYLNLVQNFNYCENYQKIYQKEIDDLTKKMNLGEEKLNKIENQTLVGMPPGNLVKCSYKDCGEQNQFEPESIDYNIRDDQNKVI